MLRALEADRDIRQSENNTNMAGEAQYIGTLLVHINLISPIFHLGYTILIFKITNTLITEFYEIITQSHPIVF